MPAEIDIVLRGERAYFIKALMAVLTNAAQHSEKGGIVDVTTTVTGSGDLEISVEDRGPGIPPDLLPHLTDQFVHGESAFTRKRDGVGLGAIDVQPHPRYARGAPDDRQRARRANARRSRSILRRGGPDSPGARHRHGALNAAA